VFDKRFRVKCAPWIRPVCSSLLITSLLLATEQSPAQKAWIVLEAGFHDKSADKRAQAVSVLGLIPRDNKAIETAEDALIDPDADVCR
jgi:hypothetical protein